MREMGQINFFNIVHVAIKRKVHLGQRERIASQLF